MKTKNAILTDFYAVVKATPAIVALNGGIYKNTRPNTSQLEDCVISLIPGTVAKFIQSGALYIKLFYLDNNNNNTYSEDELRGGYMEGLLQDLSTVFLNLNDYSFDIQSRETGTEAVQTAKVWQHYAILKINFEILN